MMDLAQKPYIKLEVKSRRVRKRKRNKKFVVDCFAILRISESLAFLPWVR
jgi:hypothetical protein